MKTLLENGCAAVTQETKIIGQPQPWKRASCFLLAIAIHALSAGADLNAAENAPPPVVFSVEPEESGELVYLSVVAETADESPGNLFGLRVLMSNNATNEVRLTTIRITFTFADNAILTYQFSRDVVIDAGQSATEYLAPTESIQLPEPAPVSARIDLFFEGFALPRTVQRNLAPYTAPTSTDRYLFPGNESDLGPDEYFSHVEPHTGGSQFFGYDFHVRGWNGEQFSSVQPDGDPATNEGQLAWNVPIYAMADGVVLRASLGWEDNPAPGTRVIQRMGEHPGEPIADVKVTALSSERAATVARLPSGAMRINVWDLEDNGRDIIERGSAAGEAAGDVATDSLTGSRLVTAIRTSGANLRVIIWDISPDGMTITRLGQGDAGPVKELSLTRLSSSQFATAVRTQDDALRLMVWNVSADGLTVSLLNHDFAGTASSISVVAMNSTRMVTSLRTAEGTLKVIVWDFENGTTLVRRGDATADPILKAAVTKVTGNQVVAAMRTATGHLKVIQWTLSDDGESVIQEREVVAGLIQDLAPPVVSNFSGFDNVFTAVITQDGNYKNILWRQPDTDASDDPGLFYRFGEREAGPADRLYVDTPEGAFFVSAVRTAGGNLKVITWRAGGGGGNSLVILHGDCRVLYAHFKNESVSPALAYPGARVVAGQFLGRMGNSGRSAGPHLHIHSERVSPFLTLEDLLALEAQDSPSVIGYRPIPFHCARAVRLNALLPGGEGNPDNAFSPLSGHGIYFAQYAIRPAWLKEMHVDWSSNCLAPEGRLNCEPLGQFSIGGPFPTVTQALNTSCWGHQLLIRAGAYPETVTFHRAMTIRSYDGTAIVGQ